MKRNPGLESNSGFRSLRWVQAGLALSLVCLPLRAEVSALTDDQGRLQKVLFLDQVRGSRHLIWGPVRPGVASSALLNPAGDRMGDLPPFVFQGRGRQPWVVWPAGDGHDLEIAVATWVDGRWRGPELVERVDNPFDDLNPGLALDGRGRPVAVWWRNEPTPRVYLSVLREKGWTTPLAISDPATPSRHPSVKVEGTRAVVTFYTPRGQTVLFQELSMLGTVELEGKGPLDGPVPPPDWQSDPTADPSGNTNTPPASSSEIPSTKRSTNN